MPSRIFLCAAVLIHIVFLASLLSEPLILEHGTHLTGSKTHPLENPQYRGFMDAWFHDTDRVPRGLDFFSIYQAGRNFIRGQSVYFGVREHRLGNEALVVPYFSGFRYLPVYACTYGVILNVLPPWYSYWTWIAVVEILLLLNLWIIWKLPLSVPHQRILTAMWLAYSPYYVELHIGQQSMVTVTLLHCVLLGALTSRAGMRDISYAGSVIWKLNTILFIPIWIKLKRFKTIAVLFLLIVALSAPYFAFVPGSFQEFSSYFHDKFIATGPNSLGFWSLTSMFLSHQEVSHETIRQVMKYWTLFIWTVASLATLIPRRIQFTRALAMWICVYFLTYQYVWEHHYVLMLPVFTAGMLVPSLRRLTACVWLLCALPTPYFLWNNPALAMPQTEWSLLQNVVYHSTKLVPVLVLFAVLIFQLIRNHTGDPGDTPETSMDQLDILSLWTTILRKDHRETSTSLHSRSLPSKS